MSEGRRWKYRKVTVEHDGNSIELRELTAGERQEFIDLNKSIKDGQRRAIELGYFLLTRTADLSEEDVRAMPQEFFDKACSEAAKLAGMSEKKTPDPEPPEPVPAT